MNVINRTPFPALPFESVTSEEEPFFVTAIRGTFDIVNNAPLRPCTQQEPLILADQYQGDINASSLRWPNDLSPLKPNTDIHLLGTAKSPKPARSWEVSLVVGSLQHRVTVTGPREWRFSLFKDWQLSEPELCSEVELKYELAFGGTWEAGDENGFSESNPIGVGLASLKHVNRRQPISAPQILPSDAAVPPLGQSATPAGFGPVAPAWIQRRKFAGTYDEAWQETKAPLPPQDFKYDFYNSAHPDLVYPGFLNGNERVEINGVSAAGPIRFSLPDYSVGAQLTDESGYQFASLAELDTLQIDIDAMRACLVWRITAPIIDGDAISQVYLKMKEGASKRQALGGARHG